MWTLVCLIACGGDTTIDSGVVDTSDTSASANVDPDFYGFTSALTGEASVSYSGQVFRQLLIDDMKAYLADLTGRINEGSFFPGTGDIETDLGFYLDFDGSVSGSLSHGIQTDPSPMQSTYDDVSSGKNLAGKIAGNDATGQHKDWATEMVGWEADGVSTPESLVRHWIAMVDAQAADWTAGTIPMDPEGNPVSAVFVTSEGQDLQQLLQKFLRISIAYSQGADDYLDDDTEGKGLLSSHEAAEDGKPYTALEHAWDEGFGYFGAAANYPEWTDEEIAGNKYADVDEDGSIDLKSEYNWGHSVNAAKRDKGAVSPTDFTSDAWNGFWNGRLLLAETAGNALTADQLSELQGHRDQALEAWEMAIVATVVHYINELLQDMAMIGTGDFDFGGYAKHWSELKGFALGLQFNRFSPLTDAQFSTIHDALGIQPVSPAAPQTALDAYATELVTVRGLLGTAYGIADDNLGDDNGEAGW